MNIAMRKLAMLEKSILEQEENARLEGYTINPVDSEFKEKITRLMERVRVI